MPPLTIGTSARPVDYCSLSYPVSNHRLSTTTLPPFNTHLTLRVAESRVPNGDAPARNSHEAVDRRLDELLFVGQGAVLSNEKIAFHFVRALFYRDLILRCGVGGTPEPAQEVGSDCVNQMVVRQFDFID